MNTISERRYDIDWLRVIAIGFLLIYHIAIGFQPWGILIAFIQTNEPLESIWVAMSMLNVWRIPFLFFVSGMGVCFAMRKRDWKALIGERALRILVPFIFGMLAIVPLHVFVFQSYYNQPITYIFNPWHLWFLGNLFIYVLLLAPWFYYLKRNAGGRLQQFLNKVFSTPLGLVPVMLFFVAEAVIMNPESFETYAMNFHGFWLGLLAFFFGYHFVYSGQGFWIMVKRWKWVLLLLAVGLYVYRLLAFDLRSPNYLLSIESNLWVFAILGIGYSYLNRPSKALTYLSQAAYPVYIIHMVWLYLGASWLFVTDIPVIWQFVLLILITMGGCMLSYELVIRRVRFLRPLFGLKILPRKGKDPVISPKSVVQEVV